MSRKGSDKVCPFSVLVQYPSGNGDETFDGFQGGLQIGGQMITNLCNTADIILLATSEAELQELVDRLDRVSRKYINVDKTKVMASDGIACRILIQNEQLEQVDTFPYIGSPNCRRW